MSGMPRAKSPPATPCASSRKYQGRLLQAQGNLPFEAKDWSGTITRLFQEALRHSETRKSGDPRQLVKKPNVFVIDYNDGLKHPGRPHLAHHSNRRQPVSPSDRDRREVRTHGW
jgi:hypothetical protein